MDRASKCSAVIATLECSLTFNGIFRHFVIKHILVIKDFIALQLFKVPCTATVSVYAFDAFSGFIVAFSATAAGMAKYILTLTSDGPLSADA